MPQTPSQSQQSLQITGIITRVRFRAETGFTVISADIRTQEGEDDDATVIGVMPLLEEGETFSAQVTIEQHRQYGHQYRVVTMLLESVPSDLSEEGIAAYLAARVSGVGKVLAKRIVQKFGTAAFDIFEEDPERLLAVKGISPRKLKQMLASWYEQGQERRSLAALQGLGLSLNQAQRVLDHFGHETVLGKIDNDLFVITEVDGIGFVSADKIWQKQGNSLDDPRRLCAAAVYAMEQAAQQAGHSYLPFERVARGVEYYTRADSEQASNAVQQALELYRLKSESVTVADKSSDDKPSELRVYLPKLHQTEKKLAQLVRTLLATPPKSQAWQIEPQHSEGLSAEQAEVLELLTDNRLVVLTGGPGTGKSTTTRNVVEAAQDMGLSVALCAPTGKAARRLGEVTGQNAKTIHRLLGYGPQGFKHNDADPAPFDLFIADEVSMMGDALMTSLLSGIPAGARVLLVGDIDQLPPIDSGLPLQALVAVAPTVRLSKIYRQAAGNPIIDAAYAINNASIPQWNRSNLMLCEASPLEGATLIPQILQQLGGPSQAQVITPMRRGPLGVDNLNQQIQAIFNPLPIDSKQKVKIANAEAQAGDRVVQTKNDYDNDVFNGTQGLVLEAGSGKITVDFDSNVVELSGSDLFNVQLGYALTVHRAQGSEWPTVIMALHEAHMPMLSRNLAYTALTRASQSFVAVGSASAWQIAASRQRAERYSGLLSRIRLS